MQQRHRPSVLRARATPSVQARRFRPASAPETAPRFGLNTSRDTWLAVPFHLPPAASSRRLRRIGKWLAPGNCPSTAIPGHRGAPPHHHARPRCDRPGSGPRPAHPASLGQPNLIRQAWSAPIPLLPDPPDYHPSELLDPRCLSFPRQELVENRSPRHRVHQHPAQHLRVPSLYFFHFFRNRFRQANPKFNGTGIPHRSSLSPRPVGEPSRIGRRTRRGPHHHLFRCESGAQVMRARRGRQADSVTATTATRYIYLIAGQHFTGTARSSPKQESDPYDTRRNGWFDRWNS